MDSKETEYSRNHKAYFIYAYKAVDPTNPQKTKVVVVEGFKEPEGET